MTPLQIAKSHCANYQDDGSCLGAQLDDDLQIRRCTPRPRCVLAQHGIRCAYFEECVLPMNSGDWPDLKTPAQHQAFADAARDYRIAANAPSDHKRICPDCNERPLEPRKKRCYVCQEAKRKQQLREANQKRGV